MRLASRERGRFSLRFLSLGVARLSVLFNLGICVLRADAFGGLFGSVGVEEQVRALTVLSIWVFYGLVPFSNNCSMAFGERGMKGNHRKPAQP